MGSTKTCNSCTVETQICNFSDIDEKNLYQNHYVIKEAEILSTKNLSSKKIYSILISNIVNKPTPNIYFEKLFENHSLNWSKIYSVTRLATIDSTFHSFQYKTLDNVLFLNKKLYTFGIKTMSFANFAKNIYNLLNHSSLILKYYVYRSREKQIRNIDILIENEIEIKKK